VRLRRWIGAALALQSASAQALNNCLPGDFLDRRGRDDVVIANDQPGNPFLYRPRCVTVSAGAAVLFRALPNFGNHPLFAGVVSAGSATFDPGSPIGSITSGEERQVVFDQEGEYPYYCDFHFAQGMLGSVRVVPEWFANGFE
jgi:plastocyanin